MDSIRSSHNYKRALLVCVAALFISSLAAAQVADTDSLKRVLSTHTTRDSVRLDVLMALSKTVYVSEPAQSQVYLEEALEIAMANGYAFRRAKIQQEQVQHYALSGEVARAIEVGLLAIRSFDSLGKSTETLITQSDLVAIYMSEGFYDQALAMSLQCLEQVKEDPDTPTKARFYFTVGNVYKSLAIYEKAILYYNIALEISRKVGFKPGEAVISVNMGFCMLSLARYAEAKNYLRPQLNYFAEANNVSLAATTYGYLGQIAAKTFDHSAAIDYYEEARARYEELGFLENVQDINGRLYVQYSITGQQEEAEAADQVYQHLKDSLKKEEITQAIADLQTQYETEKKEAEITSLKQSAAIQALKIRQRNLVIGISVALFIMVVGGVVFTYRQRSMSNRRRQIELEQRFLRTQLNPHFISNALVAVQSSLLEKDISSAELFLGTFARLMREILENSRRAWITIEEETKMLEDYLQIHQKRLKDELQYALVIDEEIDPSFDQIPPMMIQPFVENAVEHGVAPVGDKKQIEVAFHKGDACIEVTITDNGGGLSHVANAQKRSLSTQITHERIALLNESLRKNIALKVEEWGDKDQPARGVKVSLTLPLG